MILMLKFIDGKKVMIDFDDVVAVEEVSPEGTLIILIRDGSSSRSLLVRL